MGLRPPPAGREAQRSFAGLAALGDAAGRGALVAAKRGRAARRRAGRCPRRCHRSGGGYSSSSSGCRSSSSRAGGPALGLPPRVRGRTGACRSSSRQRLARGRLWVPVLTRSCGARRRLLISRVPLQRTGRFAAEAPALPVLIQWSGVDSMIPGGLRVPSIPASAQCSPRTSRRDSIYIYTLFLYPDW